MVIFQCPQFLTYTSCNLEDIRTHSGEVFRSPLSADSGKLHRSNGALIYLIPHSSYCLSLGITRFKTSSISDISSLSGIPTVSLYFLHRAILPPAIISSVTNALSPIIVNPEYVMVSERFGYIRPESEAIWNSCHYPG